VQVVLRAATTCPAVMLHSTTTIPSLRAVVPIETMSEKTAQPVTAIAAASMTQPLAQDALPQL
jgi:hypothetical protein